MGFEAHRHFKPFTSSCVVMLNVLSGLRRRRPFHFVMQVAVLAGALLAMTSMAIIDQQSLAMLAAQQLKKDNLSLQLQTKNLSSNHTPATLEALQHSIRQQQQWLETLQAQQQMREDLQTVQNLLFVRLTKSTEPSVQLQQLLWQDGALKWEGYASTPEALQAMLRQLSQFPRWKNPPGVVQVQALTGAVLVSAAAQPAPAPTSTSSIQHAFKIAGRIESGPSTLAVTETKP